MDIKQLSYFVQIAIDENYSAASRKLYVSQPALSKAIKNLEQELGIKLFYSLDRKTKLTEAGRTFFNKSKKLLEDYQALIEYASHSDIETSGKITIGLPPVFGTCFFSRFVSGFQNLYPDIEIIVVNKGSTALQEDVLANLIDFAYVMPPIFSNQFDTIPLISGKNSLIVSENHPLASRQTVRLEELPKEKFLLLDKEFTLRRLIISACRESGFEPNISIETHQWDFLIELVRANYGISILPEPIFEKFEHSGVRLLSIDHPVSDWYLTAITKRGHYLSPPCKKLISYLEDNFSQTNEQK